MHLEESLRKVEEKDLWRFSSATLTTGADVGGTCAFRLFPSAFSPELIICRDSWAHLRISGHEWLALRLLLCGSGSIDYWSSNINEINVQKIVERIYCDHGRRSNVYLDKNFPRIQLIEELPAITKTHAKAISSSAPALSMVLDDATRCISMTFKNGLPSRDEFIAGLNCQWPSGRSSIARHPRIFKLSCIPGRSFFYNFQRHNLPSIC